MITILKKFRTRQPGQEKVEIFKSHSAEESEQRNYNADRSQCHGLQRKPSRPARETIEMNARNKEKERANDDTTTTANTTRMIKINKINHFSSITQYQTDATFEKA